MRAASFQDTEQAVMNAMAQKDEQTALDLCYILTSWLVVGYDLGEN